MSPNTVGENFAVGLGYTDVENFPPMQGQVRLGSDGSLRALASLFDVSNGIGLYGMLPGEYFLSKKFVKNGVISDRYSGQQHVGYGIGGAPVRYTHSVSSTEGRPLGGPLAAASSSSLSSSSAASAEPVSPGAVTATPAEAADSASGRAGASSPVLPEIGARYVAAGQDFSVGGHVGLGSSLPLKLWAVGTYGKNGAVTAGLQVATDSIRLSSPGALQRPADAVDIDAAVSLSQEPLYELSLALDSTRKEVVAGYTHSLTVRRNVYNVMERRNVKGIYMYADMGFEVRRALLPPFASTLAFASSLQLNRSSLVKLRVGSRDISASWAIKTWTDPAATLCLTGVWDRHRNNTGLGIAFSIEKGGLLQYQKAIAGYQSVAPSMALKASPQLSEPMTRSVDQRPFADPPIAGRPGAPKPVINVGNRFL